VLAADKRLQPRRQFVTFAERRSIRLDGNELKVSDGRYQPVDGIAVVHLEQAHRDALIGPREDRPIVDAVGHQPCVYHPARFGKRRRGDGIVQRRRAVIGAYLYPAGHLRLAIAGGHDQDREEAADDGEGSPRDAWRAQCGSSQR
jgi:hypothetical protein